MKKVYHQSIMLGYVTIEKNELKVREYTLYQGYYCGICKSIAGRIGQLPRFGLSYDAVFLALVLAGLLPDSDLCASEHCMVHPMSKKPVVRGSTAVDYAADVMVILAYHKFLDDWHDERSAAGFAGKLAFGRAYRKLRKQYPNVCMHVEAALSKLSALEAEQSGSIDRTSEAFSDLMESLFTGFAEKYRDAVSPVQERVLSQLGRALGRWIYMIDALDDFAKDEKCGSYNPLLYRKNYLAGMEILLYHSLAEIEKAYDLLDFAKNREIIENIIFLGLRLQTDRVLAERIHVDAQSI